MLALPLITVHVGAHPLKLAAHAQTGETNDILARSREQSNGQSSNGHPHSHTNVNSERILRTLLATVRAGLLFLPDRTGTEFAADRHLCLQELFGIFIHPHDGVPLHSRDHIEEGMLRTLERHALGFNAAVGQAWNYYSGRPGPNGRANGNSPNGHPQTSDNSYTDPLAEVRESVLSYHASGVTEEAKGKYLEDLLLIFTSRRVWSWGGASEEERTWLHHFRVHALALKDAMYEAYAYYHASRHLSLDHLAEMDYL
jgi:hypothetical protein